MGNIIYFDNAATTKQDERVTSVMLKYMNEEYGNASAQYSLGFTCKRALNQAREHAANLINADISEITFTSGGTEADNFALNYMYLFDKGKSLVTTAIEHPAILNCCKKLERDGYIVKYIKPDKYGICSLNEIEKAIDGSTVMVSVMMANNEIGTIQPISDISRIAKKHNCIFHTDAVQCVGILDIDVKQLGIDLLSASGHKLYGPKGTGFIYIKRGLKIPCLIEGGGQEYGLRSGTENVPAIAGFGEACRIAKEEISHRQVEEANLSSYIAEKVLNEIKDSYLNGVNILDSNMRKYRLPGNLHFSFLGVDGSSLRALLDMKDICVSTGSACTASNKKHSHVLEAIGLGSNMIEGSLRITIGKNNTFEDADRLIEVLGASVESIRRLTNYKYN